jgi:hypothetical protein
LSSHRPKQKRQQTHQLPPLTCAASHPRHSAADVLPHAPMWQCTKKPPHHSSPTCTAQHVTPNTQKGTASSHPRAQMLSAYCTLL